MKEYPGLTVSVRDVRGNDIIDMLNENYDNGNDICDIALRNDNDGVLSNDLLPRGVVYKYTPYDIKEHMIPGCDDETLMLMGEAQILIYNDEIYSEMPVSNWWELTEEHWKNKVVIASLMRSITGYSFLATILSRGELMEEAYKKWSGKSYETIDGLDAGHYFLRQLMENGLVLTNSSYEVMEMIGLPNTHNDSLGIVISSKLRLCDIGFCVAPVTEIGRAHV